MGSGRPGRCSFPLLSPQQMEPMQSLWGSEGSSQGFLNTIQDEKVEGLNHFRDPKYEAPFTVYVF